MIRILPILWFLLLRYEQWETQLTNCYPQGISFYRVWWLVLQRKAWKRKKRWRHLSFLAWSARMLLGRENHRFPYGRRRLCSLLVLILQSSCWITHRSFWHLSLWPYSYSFFSWQLGLADPHEAILHLLLVTFFSSMHLSSSRSFFPGDRYNECSSFRSLLPYWYRTSYAILHR